MIAYEFYWRDPIKGYQRIGVQPERRKNPTRITQESIFNLARELIGDNADAKDIFFIRITKVGNTGEILRPDSVYGPSKEYFKDRRQYPRISMELPLEYESMYDIRAHGGIVIDASETGFLLYSTENIPIGTRLKIAVLFPAEYELAKFEVLAEIIRKEFVAEREDWHQEGYQYGLKIIYIVEEDYWKLRRLLSGGFK